MMEEKHVVVTEEIAGVEITPMTRHTDERGWLCECFRNDEIDREFAPVMAYMSVTEPGAARGPHEHRDQADLFTFAGPSDFLLYLWDNRDSSPTFGMHQKIVVGERNPCRVLIPAGIVHGYKNIGEQPGLVCNAPNRLFGGEGKKEPIDEIRYEETEPSRFVLD